jgi:hypothetical protein
VYTRLVPRRLSQVVQYFEKDGYVQCVVEQHKMQQQMLGTVSSGGSSAQALHGGDGDVVTTAASMVQLRAHVTGKNGAGDGRRQGVHRHRRHGRVRQRRVADRNDGNGFYSRCNRCSILLEEDTVQREDIGGDDRRIRRRRLGESLRSPLIMQIRYSHLRHHSLHGYY